MLAVALLLLAAQPSDTFEVASVKPSRPGAQFSETLDAAQFTCTAHALMHLIMNAWPDIEFQPWKALGGPAWINKDTWDLSAKLPPNMPTEPEALNRRTEAMLRTYLAEAFQLKTHRETKEYPVYALVVAKSGPKLKPTEAGEFRVGGGNGRIEFHHQSVEGLTSWLSGMRSMVDRPVIDMTKLEGFYDFTLDLSSSDGVQPSIYSVLEEQLGLKLLPQKSPVEFLVIDHAEKPAGN